MKKNIFLVILICIGYIYQAYAVIDTLPPRIKKNKYNPDFEAFLNDAILPDIPIISCDQLKTLQETNREMAIFDTRSVEEYNISHIRNARRIGYEDFSIEKIWAYDREKPVIIYGSSGEMSEEMGKKLQRLGFKDVRNLYASIFEWMYEGGEVVDENDVITNRIKILNKERLRFLRSPY